MGTVFSSPAKLNSHTFVINSTYSTLYNWLSCDSCFGKAMDDGSYERSDFLQFSALKTLQKRIAGRFKRAAFFGSHATVRRF